MFRSLVINEMISVPETLMERRTVQEQQVRYEQRPRTVTVYKQVPRVVNVAETRMQQRTQTGYQAVPRNVVTPVTIARQGFANRVGVRQVARNIPVTVNRVATSQYNGTQSSPGLASVQTMSAPTQQVVQQVVNQQRIFNQQYTYQVPVTRYQIRQVIDDRPIAQTVNIPVTVQVPRQQVRTRQVNTIADSASEYRNETSPRPANAERGLC